MQAAVCLLLHSVVAVRLMSCCSASSKTRCMLLQPAAEVHCIGMLKVMSHLGFTAALAGHAGRQ